MRKAERQIDEDIGLVGLGRMGAAIAQRLTQQGCAVVAWDRNAQAVSAHAARGGAVAVQAHGTPVVKVYAPKDLAPGTPAPALLARMRCAAVRPSRSGMSRSRSTTSNGSPMRAKCSIS